MQETDPQRSSEMSKIIPDIPAEFSLVSKCLSDLPLCLKGFDRGRLSIFHFQLFMLHFIPFECDDCIV